MKTNSMIFYLLHTLRERAGLRGALVLAFLFLVGCGSGGGSTPVASDGSSPQAPQGPKTRQMTIYHSWEFACWITDDQARLYCWASEPVAAYQTNAIAMGLSEIPLLMATIDAGYPRMFLNLRDDSIWASYSSAGSHCLAGVGGEPGCDNVATDQTYVETVTCTYLSSDSVQCPEDVAVLQFSGETLF